ncbi:chaplin [Streptomyces sp. NPDC050803]|uniref:chaplin n=1 Tax=unclassified Streptomyces TaxID=2593676 RepID=UPI003428556C
MRTSPVLAVAALVMVTTLGGAGTAAADFCDEYEACAQGSATNSPGVGSGNLVQAPVHAPVNACGNTVTVVGIQNHTTDDVCVND